MVRRIGQVFQRLIRFYADIPSLDKDKEALFNVAYNVTDNISS